MAKKKLTQREKTARAAFKKQMQEKGVLPPDKPKLNREKFIKETVREWNERSGDCMIWDICLTQAASWMMGHRERNRLGLSLEAVGAAKVLKTAIWIEKFNRELREKGQKEYKLDDQYDYIKDILEA